MNLEKFNVVKDRLILVNHLNNAEHHFKGRLYPRYLSANRLEYPLYKNYFGLKTYLLLTCFDILGQPDEWLDFNNWLNCKNRPEIVIEKNKIFEKVKFKDPVKDISQIHQEYNKIYGVKNSFFSFVKNVITEENRIKLFNSIRNTERVSEHKFNEDGTQSPPVGKRIELDNELKLKFLFQLRNSFTHKGIAYGTSIGAVFDINKAHEFTNGKPSHYLYDIHTEKLNGKIITWKVHRWPFILSEIINETLISLKCE
jgi:hypothetical protein